MLKLLSILTHSWTNITLDFITGLPLSNGYNIVLMVIEQLIKKRYFILCTINKNNTTAKATAYLLFNNVWKFHSCLLSLILDQGLQFVSRVWKKHCKILDIKVNLSSTFYPEID